MTLLNITQANATPLEGFQITLRSASSERAAEIAREQIENHYLKTMTSALTGDLAAQRAALVFAHVAGIQVMRQMIGRSVLADADPATLIELLGPVCNSSSTTRFGLGDRRIRRFDSKGVPDAAAQMNRGVGRTLARFGRTDQ